MLNYYLLENKTILWTEEIWYSFDAFCIRQECVKYAEPFKRSLFSIPFAGL